MTKTPEEIIASFEDKFKLGVQIGDGQIKEVLVAAQPEDIKSFLAESLAAYRLSVLSECEGLVEDEKPSIDQDRDCEIPMPAWGHGFNAANALWRERIAELKKK